MASEIRKIWVMQKNGQVVKKALSIHKEGSQLKGNLMPLNESVEANRSVSDDVAGLPTKLVMIKQEECESDSMLQDIEKACKNVEFQSESSMTKIISSNRCRKVLPKQNKPIKVANEKPVTRSVTMLFKAGETYTKKSNTLKEENADSLCEIIKLEADDEILNDDISSLNEIYSLASDGVQDHVRKNTKDAFHKVSTKKPVQKLKDSMSGDDDEEEMPDLWEVESTSSYETVVLDLSDDEVTPEADTAPVKVKKENMAASPEPYTTIVNSITNVNDTAAVPEGETPKGAKMLGTYKGTQSPIVPEDSDDANEAEGDIWAEDVDISIPEYNICTSDMTPTVTEYVTVGDESTSEQEKSSAAKKKVPKVDYGIKLNRQKNLSPAKGSTSNIKGNALISVLKKPGTKAGTPAKKTSAAAASPPPTSSSPAAILDASSHATVTNSRLDEPQDSSTASTPINSNMFRLTIEQFAALPPIPSYSGWGVPPPIVGTSKKQEQQMYVCTIPGCRVACITKSTYTLHAKKHRDEMRLQGMDENGMYICDECGKQFAKYDYLQKHKMRHTGLFLKCLYCDKRFNDYTMRLAHMDRMHAEDRPYKCSKCTRRFTTAREKQSHERNTQDFPNHGKEDQMRAMRKKRIRIIPDFKLQHRRFTCFVCNKRHSCLKELQQHNSEVHGVNSDRPLEIFRNRRRKQSEIPAEEKRHKCKICGKVYSAVTGLYIHMAQHRGTYKCEWCDYRATSNRALRYHLGIKHDEMGKKPHFMCSLCNKVCRSMSGVTRHQNLYHQDQLGYRSKYDRHKYDSLAVVKVSEEDYHYQKQQQRQHHLVYEEDIEDVPTEYIYTDTSPRSTVNIQDIEGQLYVPSEDMQQQQPAGSTIDLQDYSGYQYRLTVMEPHDA